MDLFLCSVGLSKSIAPAARRPKRLPMKQPIVLPLLAATVTVLSVAALALQ